MMKKASNKSDDENQKKISLFFKQGTKAPSSSGLFSVVGDGKQLPAKPCTTKSVVPGAISASLSTKRGGANRWPSKREATAARGGIIREAHVGVPGVGSPVDADSSAGDMDIIPDTPDNGDRRDGSTVGKRKICLNTERRRLEGSVGGDRRHVSQDSADGHLVAGGGCGTTGAQLTMSKVHRSKPHVVVVSTAARKRSRSNGESPNPKKVARKVTPGKMVAGIRSTADAFLSPSNVLGRDATAHAAVACPSKVVKAKRNIFTGSGCDVSHEDDEITAGVKNKNKPGVGGLGRALDVEACESGEDALLSDIMAEMKDIMRTQTPNAGKRRTPGKKTSPFPGNKAANNAALKASHYVNTFQNKTPSRKAGLNKSPGFTRTEQDFATCTSKENQPKRGGEETGPCDEAVLGLSPDIDTVSQQLDRLSPFKFDPNDWDDEMEAEEGRVPPCQAFGRHKVRDVIQQGGETLLKLECACTGQAKTVELQGFWSETHVQTGDIVNVIGSFNADQRCVVSDRENLLILSPDILISGTAVVSGVTCMRRSVLKEKFKGCDSMNTYMLYGSITHSLFQQALSQKCLNASTVNVLMTQTIKQPAFLHQMFALGVTEDTVKEEIGKYVSPILQFAEKHVRTGGHRFGDKESSGLPIITQIADIEENVWSPRFGIKGKIDLTVEVKTHDRQPTRRRTKIMPLELKTGKSSFSVEHKGQVTLYSMMSSDRRESPDGGLLLYLKDGRMEFIPANHANQQGLIQMRNEMAYYISSATEKALADLAATEGDPEDDVTPASHWGKGTLPAPINREMICSKCPQLINCAAYQRSIEDYTPSEGHIMSTLVSQTLSHLTEEHVTFFSHWCRLLHLEQTASRARGTGRDVWCKTAWYRESRGECFSEMTLVTDRCQHLKGDNHLQVFCRSPSHPSRSPLRDVGLQRFDSVVVSADNRPGIALTTGFIRDLDGQTVALVLDRDLRLYPDHKDTVYRLDKHDYFNTMATNFTNISRLMADNPHSAKLRGIVIEERTPQFDLTLSKTSIDKVKTVFKPLNKPQKTAVLKVLMSRDYVLIKGYPGTGKTSTIVALVRILTAMGSSVLLASYTNSAVDNILLKLKKLDVDFLRIGRSQRVHVDIQPYCSDVTTASMTSLEELSSFYMSKSVVATTCHGTSHELFERRVFDVCIVDEASQVLQTTCLGPLFASRKFVLVGDPLQLPPVVQSDQARLLGMGQSLFAKLDDTGGTYELNMQYRMNGEIMRLSNELVYQGALHCGSVAVERARLQTCGSLLPEWGSAPDWLRHCVSGDPGAEVVWLDTSAVGGQQQGEGVAAAPTAPATNPGTRNRSEADLVLAIVAMALKCGISPVDVGVIAPYRHQVALIRDVLRAADIPPEVEVNTVDQYQGRDKDLVVISFVKTVQAQDRKGGDILRDVRRLNVAVTRAKHKLIMLGHVTALRTYAPLGELLGILRSSQIIALPAEVDLDGVLQVLKVNIPEKSPQMMELK